MDKVFILTGGFRYEGTFYLEVFLSRGEAHSHMEKMKADQESICSQFDSWSIQEKIIQK